MSPFNTLQDGLLDALGHYIDTQADTTCHYFVVDPMGTTLKTASLETVCIDTHIYSV